MLASSNIFKFQSTVQEKSLCLTKDVKPYSQQGSCCDSQQQKSTVFILFTLDFQLYDFSDFVGFIFDSSRTKYSLGH